MFGNGDFVLTSSVRYLLPQMTRYSQVLACHWDYQQRQSVFLALLYIFLALLKVFWCHPYRLIGSYGLVLWSHSSFRGVFIDRFDLFRRVFVPNLQCVSVSQNVRPRSHAQNALLGGSNHSETKMWLEFQHDTFFSHLSLWLPLLYISPYVVVGRIRGGHKLIYNGAEDVLPLLNFGIKTQRKDRKLILVLIQAVSVPFIWKDSEVFIEKLACKG